eukprot:CAMPEP_0176495532 /NCGR_PEP_ID=MMETSP0200_2-20121128/10706_1 /TAXON_ID=947934 /ORGANISM="Chaetoceros sp., Strain GSL56" /LENGTH=363 /DNA_ID=CAMNT_0017893415 /DNA_START=496 /DNA_END=1584 /DNA_ORIENTATION=+
MYWGRLFPVSIRRIRFSLSQLAVWHGPDVYPKDDDNSLQVCFDRQTQGQNLITVETVHYDYYYHNNNNNNNNNINSNSNSNKKISMRDVLSQRESKRAVKGYYLHNPTSIVKSCTKNCKSNTTKNIDIIDDNNNNDKHGEPPRKKVLFYLYGGAFLGGDTKGNIHYGTKLSQQCNMDVFLPQYGLLPEYHFLDALEDVIQAYVYLIEIRGIHPKDVILFGISSGGGLVVRLLQRIVQVRGSGGGSGSGGGHSISSSVNEMLQVPSGAVLLSPFVDYTTPKGSFKEYTLHDLVVNESVFEEGIPYFSTLGNDKTRHDESPINRPLAGLPPLCMVVSEHECCYDQNIVLCNRARKEGVQVDLGVW